MGLPSVKIGGIERRVKRGTLDINLKLGARGVGSCTVESLDGSYRPAVGAAVEFLDGITTVWTGNIDAVDEVSVTEAAPTARYYTIEAVGWEQRLDKRLTYDATNQLIPCYTRNYTFTANPDTDYLTAPGHGRNNGDMVRVKTNEGGTLPWPLAANTDYWVRDVSGDSLKLAATEGGAAIDITDTGDGIHKLITYRAGEIVADLLATYADNEGITAADIDPGAVVDKAVFDCVTVWDAIAELAELSNYVAWVDNDKGLHFVPRTVATAPFSITTSSGNYRHISVQTTREDKLNEALMRVNLAQLAAMEEMFAGDGATRDWVLSKRAAQVSYIRVNEATSEFVFGSNGAADYLIADGHTAQNGDRVRVRFYPGQSSPPLQEGVNYYARDVGLYPPQAPDPDSLRLAYFPGGSVINLTADGQGLLICYQTGAWYEQTYGQEGVDADKDYYWSAGETGIRQDPSRPVLAAGASLAVGYHPLGADIVEYHDAANIAETITAEGGSGKYARSFDRTDTGEGQVAVYDRAIALVEAYKANARSVHYETDMQIEATAKGLRPGQLQGIANTYFDISGDWLIDEVRIHDVGGQWLAFEVTALDGTRIGGWLEYFRDLARGKGAAISLTGGAGIGQSAGKEPLGPAPLPDVQYFKAGTVDAFGNWTTVMSWDTLRERMLIDWAVLAPEDRRNWSGVGMWIRVPKPGGGYEFFDTSGLIAVSEFKEKDGDVYCYRQHAVEPQSIPDPPETWRCIGVSYDANGQPKKDANGNPTGPYVDLQTLAAWGQLTNLAASIGEYGYDETTEPSKPVARVNVTYTNPPDADEDTYFDFWTCVTATSVIDPPDAGKFKYDPPYGVSMRWETGRTDVDMWLDRPKQGDPTDRLWIRGVTCDEFYSGPPTNESPGCYVDITAAGIPAQVTDFAVALEDCGTPAPAFWVNVTYRRPTDLDFWYAGIWRVACDSGYNPLPDEPWISVYEVGGDATPGELVTEQHGPYPYPSEIEYWKYVAKSFSRAGIQNNEGMSEATLMVPTSPMIQGAKVVNIPTASFAAGIRPVLLVASLPTLPDALYPAGTVAYHTGEVRLYKVNAAGTAWVYAVDGGKDIVADSITAGQVAAGAIRTEELYAGEILVGRGGGKPSRFRVNDAGGNMKAFLGTDDGNTYLNWFQEIWIGGTGGANAPFYVDTGGNLKLETRGGYYPTFSLTLNGVVTTINNAAMGSDFAGLKVQNSTTQRFAAVTPDLFYLGHPTGGAAIYMEGSTGWLSAVGVVQAGAFYRGPDEVINTGSAFVGKGIIMTAYPCTANYFIAHQGGIAYAGVYGPSTFTTADGKTVTVRGGIIVNIV